MRSWASRWTCRLLRPPPLALGAAQQRKYLHKAADITDHQPYLNAIADELNDRPRQTLGFLTPREVFNRLLTEKPVATTS